MTDIVERLRHVDETISISLHDLIEDAADEIERLQREVRYWHHREIKQRTPGVGATL
jgi:hypothetical protein